MSGEYKVGVAETFEDGVALLHDQKCAFVVLNTGRFQRKGTTRILCWDGQWSRVGWEMLPEGYSRAIDLNGYNGQVLTAWLPPEAILDAWREAGFEFLVVIPGVRQRRREPEVEQVVQQRAVDRQPQQADPAPSGVRTPFVLSINALLGALAQRHLTYQDLVPDDDALPVFALEAPLDEVFEGLQGDLWWHYFGKGWKRDQAERLQASIVQVLRQSHSRGQVLDRMLEYDGGPYAAIGWLLWQAGFNHELQFKPRDKYDQAKAARMIEQLNPNLFVIYYKGR